MDESQDLRTHFEDERSRMGVIVWVIGGGMLCLIFFIAGACLLALWTVTP